MTADTSAPNRALGVELSQEILALYREARAGLDTDFKRNEMTRAHGLLPISASSWVNGVLGEQGPLIHEASSIDLKPGFWEAMAPFMASGQDPLGPMMYAAPGRWLPAFSEAERLMHEQLLPHWMEGLALHRVLSAARAAELVWQPGHTIAVVDRTGLIHHAQAGFGELLKEELPDWRGAALPAALVDALHRDGDFEGTVVRATWRATTADGASHSPSADGLMVVEMSHRHAATTAAIARDLRSSMLDASLESTERRLGMVSGALAEQQRRQAVLDERQRIMRELHDGVGSHLVGLLNLAHRGTLEPAAMEEAVLEALDEMRMAVDSMQSTELDVGTALANLRYRLQPRFDTAGIAIHWTLPGEADVPAMPPADVFQWQRVLLEALTNILRHSHATTTRFVARAAANGDAGIDVTITDDGVGLGDGRGQGTRNMRHRARAISARLAFEPAAPSGTVVKLWWPAAPRQGGHNVVGWVDVPQRPPSIETDPDFGRPA